MAQCGIGILQRDNATGNVEGEDVDEQRRAVAGQLKFYAATHANEGQLPSAMRFEARTDSV
jgi:hypothetical protein